LPKKPVQAPKRELTKRQLTHWQRENRIQRFTLWGGIAVIVAVLALVGVGLYMDKVKPNQETVIKVGNTSYNMGYFIDALDYYGRANFSTFQGMGYEYSQFLSYITGSLAGNIEQNQIVKEAAAKLDPPITISDDEVSKFIKDNKIPNNKASRDAVYAALLESKLTEKFDKALPDSTEQRATLAMFLESESQIQEVKARMQKGETFNDIAASTSLDESTKSKSGDLGWVPARVLPTIVGNADDRTLDDLVFSPNTKVNAMTQAKDDAKTKNMGYWILQVTDYRTQPTSPDNNTPSTQAQVNAMLLSSKELALDMKKQLQSGADFATLAKANSQYTNASQDGGVLGYIAKGKLDKAVDDAVFPNDPAQQMAKGQFSDPIPDTTQSTKGGYWLVQVTGIENKTLDGTNRSTLTNLDKQAWRTEVWTAHSSEISDTLDQTKISDATAKAIEIYNKSRR
jgi:parvulin-like peptidyl-prolyl isomerase